LNIDFVITLRLIVIGAELSSLPTSGQCRWRTTRAIARIKIERPRSMQRGARGEPP
jgi:hypothetical protein